MTKNARFNRYWGNESLPKSKADFFNAVTTPTPSGDGTVATIRMYGPIDSWGGFWGISTKDVGQVLDALDDSVTQIILRINSPGGEVFEGVSILNMLRAHKASVTAVVDGLAASAASFIAAGCDETVMSPGTQMMIHSPSVIAWGNAAELRKTADILDGLEASIISIYVGKAGEKDWAQLLADDTWMTAEETVALGLADRIAVIPDAGETETVGDRIVVVEDGDVEDLARMRMSYLPDRMAARSPELPDSVEPGDPNRKDNVVAYDDLKAGIIERLGVTDANASDETLLAALDESLGEQAEHPTFVAPEGTVVVDSQVFATLQSDATAGRQARDEQNKNRRDAIVASALKDGRISAANRDTWRDNLETDEERTTKLLDTLPKNTVPVEEIGHSDEPSTVDSLALAAGWVTPKKEA